MAQFVFHIVAQFGKGPVKSIRHKKRIITKAVLAARFKEDPAFAGAIERWRFRLQFIGITNR